MLSNSLVGIAMRQTNFHLRMFVKAFPSFLEDTRIGEAVVQNRTVLQQQIVVRLDVVVASPITPLIVAVNVFVLPIALERFDPFGIEFTFEFRVYLRNFGGHAWKPMPRNMAPTKGFTRSGLTDFSISVFSIWVRNSLTI